MISNMQIILSVVVLLIIPILIGYSVCLVLGKEKRITNFLIYGFISICAITQVLGIPFYLFNISFSFYYYLMLFLITAIILYGIIKSIIEKDFEIKTDIKNLYDLICVAIVLFVFLNFIYQIIIHQHIDEDDSRFVVNIVDMLETNKFFYTNPATGFSKDLYIMQELVKDVVSPWAIYIALLSKMTTIKPVIMAHSIMPIQLYCLAMCVWWEFSGRIIKRKALYQSMFVIMMLLISVYSSHIVPEGTINKVFTKFMLRIWQGKSVVASIGIPLLFISMFDLYSNKSIKNIIFLFIVDLGICLMSGNGIAISLIVIGSFSLVYSIYIKDLYFLLKISIMLIPNIIYAIMYFVIKI